MNLSTSSHTQRVRVLYKTILKLHRGLPPEVQPLGNNYTKSEFKRHKKCTPEQAAVFMNEWTVSSFCLIYLTFEEYVFVGLCTNFG